MEIDYVLYNNTIISYYDLGVQLILRCDLYSNRVKHFCDLNAACMQKSFITTISIDICNYNIVVHS